MTFTQFHASELEPDFLDVSHLNYDRYLRGRPSTAAANPRGKHHRRPLPWKRAKLCNASGWEEDASLYRKWLWETEKKLQSTPPKDDQLQLGEDEPERPPKHHRKQPQTKQTSQPKHQAHQTTKQRKKLLEQMQKRPTNPHFLNLVDAHAKRHRTIYYKCGCCYDLSHIDSIRWWRRHWSGIRDDGVEDGIDVWVPLPGEFGSDRARGWLLEEGGEEWYGDVVVRGGDEEGVLQGDQGLDDVEVRGEGYVVRYTQGRRKMRAEGASLVGLEVDAAREGFDTTRWEWEFVGRRDDDELESVDHRSEWLAVSEGVGSWEGSDEDDWEACRN